MAIIYSYPLNDNIKPLDELVGTTMTGGKRFMLKRMISANTFVAMGDI